METKICQFCSEFQSCPRKVTELGSLCDPARLHKEIEEKNKRIEELEARLKMNSSNSSKPPSRDDYRKPPPRKNRSLREKSGRKAGGQIGHKGSTLHMIESPDNIIEHRPDTCDECNRTLSDCAAEINEKRQVHDLPPPPPIMVEEHHQMLVECPDCHCITLGAFPDDVSAPVQYGPRIKSELIDLIHGNMMSIDCATEFINSRYGTSISTGTACNIFRTCGNKLFEWGEKAKNALANAAKVCFDETGIRAEKKRQWLHSAGTRFITWLFIHSKRGREGAEAAGILPFFKGVATHDCWSTYFSFDNCLHNLCRVHILRELKFLEENFKWLKWPVHSRNSKEKERLQYQKIFQPCITITNISD